MDKRLVVKFGGTSVMTPERIKNAAKIVSTIRSQGTEVVVVVSAMGHTTDQLIQLASTVTAEVESRELDALMATGEQQSACLMAMALQDLGLAARSLSGAQAGIGSDTTYGNALIDTLDTTVLLSCLKNNIVPVVTGFQAVTKSGDITTLGRGGSDITAIALAYALRACRCDIYTDVDGLYTADPRLITEASRLEAVGVEEALKLAQNGAQVLNARSVEWARDKKVAVRVRSTFYPENPGTLVSPVATERRGFTGVAINHNIASIEMELNKLELGPDRDLRRFRLNRLETKKNLLRSFFERGLSAEFIYALRPNPFKMHFVAPPADLAEVEQALRDSALSIRHIKIDRAVACVVMVASQITDHDEVICLDLVKDNDITLLGFASGRQTIKLCVKAECALDLAHLIHDRFADKVMAA